MPPGQDPSGAGAYKPTSLDFINLPNPIEPPQPHAGAPKHPLNGTPRLEKARLDANSNRNLFNLILDSPSSERPAKRQKSTDATPLDLPKLPVRNATKRLRIPPTLSGLHQPPPDAGLLPSISVEQPQNPPPRQQDLSSRDHPPSVQQRDEGTQSITAGPEQPASAPPRKSRQKNKWSDEETEDLLKGVAKFGIGNWTKILNCDEYKFSKRTALDLKDRFRVVCPDHYKKPKKILAGSAKSTSNESETQPKTNTKGPPNERISDEKLKELGITEPFETTSRRTRQEYTDDEDRAILAGFKKHGNAWSIIRQDPEFGLSRRKATDLRDRFRTRFHEEYTKAGFGPGGNRPTSLHKLAKEQNRAAKTANSDAEAGADVPKAVASENTHKDESSHPKPSAARRPPQSLLFSLDDVFLGAPFDADEGDSEPIVLDRGILDWAGADGGKAASSEASKNTGIDPLMTLKLPKPVPASNNVLSAVPAMQTSAPQNNNHSLPSLASVLPDMPNPDQLELPSLMQWFGSMENDGRTGASVIPSLDELLS